MMKKLFFLSLLFFIACSDKSPDINQSELEMKEPAFKTIQEQIAEWYRLQEEAGGLNRQQSPLNRPADQGRDEPPEDNIPPEDGDRALPPPEERAGGEPPAPPADSDRPPEEPPPSGEVAEEDAPPPSDAGGGGDVIREEESPPPAAEAEPPPAETPPETRTRTVQAAPRRLVAVPEECDAALGLRSAGVGCVCNEAAGFFTPPNGYEPRDSQGNRRCLQRIQGAILGMRVGPFSDDGTDSAEKLDFLLCKNPINPSNSVYGGDCLRRTLPSSRNTLALDRNTTGMATFNQLASENKFYPDDAKYFYIASNASNSDRLLLAGVSLQLKLSGEPLYKYFYTNGCVWRYIEKEGGHNWYAPFSIDNDDAWCFFFDTPLNRGTDSEVSAEIPLSAELSAETQAWIDSNWNGGMITKVSRSRYARQLIAKFSLESYDDFGSDDDPGTFFAGEAGIGAKTLYGFTVYNGLHRTEDRYRIRIFGNDAWRPSQVRVLHVKPGTPENLIDFENPRCKGEVVSPGIWFSSDPYGDAGSHAVWPNNRDTRSLQMSNCYLPFENGFPEIDDPTVRTYIRLR